ncbi:DNA helicase II [Methylovulum miyakonense]|uniref:DNA helicase II n=1 Tax=Methylovulum miyakonense TaxID=645578 RepID=UPI0003810651|nr:DNA helicase II [Methylovulum miyakonense]
MDVTAIIDPLNDAQRLAVTADSGAMLVLAGAGSGKTRVLVHRMAWQIVAGRHAPHSLLAVTFTNKAAREMRSRIETLLDMSAHSLWIGTFHGLAHRLLRRHTTEARLPDSFQVMDSADQLRVIKRILVSLGYDEAKWPAKQIQWHINAQKDEGIRARHTADVGDVYQRTMLQIYLAYEQLCDRSGLVDFAELLLRAHELLRDNPGVLAHYRQRFQHVHVDEFQDTNSIQYAWLRLLTQDANNLFVVGDDDQSIYGWRGAKIENIYRFQKDNPGHQVIKLEQNYRSTGNILAAANKIIANNSGRMGKELWTESGTGEPILLYVAFNEQDEAYFVVERIRAWVNDGGMRSDVAILYRSNAQSRQFEERLMQAGMPYRVYGGLRFFDRAEIKTALAYLRLMANRHDDASFERVINTPTRGIGAKSLDDIRNLARGQTTSLWSAAILLLQSGQLSARAANALNGFLLLIKKLGDDTADSTLHEKVKTVIESSGLKDFYKKDKDKAEEKVENLEELVNAARHFETANLPDDEDNFTELDRFLSHAALESGDMQAEEFEDCVQLMTLHSAKGLEFKLVFLVGLEEGLFPSQQSVDDIARLEEERRLCYVGITRAMRQLYITYSESRQLYGRESYPRPSRFLREIPADTIQEVRQRAQVQRPVAHINVAAKPAVLTEGHSFKAGEKVKHEKFGIGTILQTEGEGAKERVQIKFPEGPKWLMLAFAKLEKV